jgi:hypothetical protein
MGGHGSFPRELFSSLPDKSAKRVFAQTVPAIQLFSKAMDARVEPGHDEREIRAEC